MGEQAQHWSNKAFFIHDIAAPDASKRVPCQSRTPPVHESPERVRHLVGLCIAPGKAKGCCFIIKRKNLRPKPLAYKGR